AFFTYCNSARPPGHGYWQFPERNHSGNGYPPIWWARLDRWTCHVDARRVFPPDKRSAGLVELAGVVVLQWLGRSAYCYQATNCHWSPRIKGSACRKSLASLSFAGHHFWSVIVGNL